MPGKLPGVFPFAALLSQAAGAAGGKCHQLTGKPVRGHDTGNPGPCFETPLLNNEFPGSSVSGRLSMKSAKEVTLCDKASAKCWKNFISLLNSLLKNATFTTGWWRCHATLFYLKNTSSHAPQGRKTHVKKQFRGAYGAPCRLRCREDPGSEGRRGQSSPNTQEPNNLKMSYAPYLCHSQWPMELSGSWSVPGNAEGKCTVNRVKTQEPLVMLMWGFS